jgi:hypothetical protein
MFARGSLLVITIFIVIVMWAHEDDNSYASTYCAYGKIFVKFKENGQTWGALMLDDDGRPMKCLEKSTDTTTKSIQLII